MGEVFLAEDIRLGRQVALKVLASETAGDPDRRAVSSARRVLSRQTRTTQFEQRQDPLFVPQHVNWIDAHRAPGGNIARDERGRPEQR